MNNEGELKLEFENFIEDLVRDVVKDTMKSLVYEDLKNYTMNIIKMHRI